MKTIKFSHDYPKLHGQTEAKLLNVSIVLNSQLQISPDLVKYDTLKSDGKYYKLDKCDYYMLLFLGNKNIPFTTFRKLVLQNDFYCKAVGETFRIEVENDK
jgi:hypothetical protein